MATILIVDDRPLSRKVLVTMLKSAGHVVIEAADGIEGLKLAERADPDLVISDILMPGLDGYELVRRMRQSASLAATPVLFYTATYHEREALALAQQCGVSGILTKPIKAAEVLAKVDETLARGAEPAKERDAETFARDHLHVVTSALAMRTDQFEASENRMAAIVDVSREISAERDPGELMRKVCAAARDVTLARHATIGVVDEDNGALRSFASSGTGLAVDPPALDETTLRAVITERLTLRRPRVDAAGALSASPYDSMVSYLVVPVATSRRVYGYLELHNKLGAPAFTDADEDVARTLGTQAAIAYENARLYEDMRRHASALEQEVVDRKKIEMALRESESRTQLALTAAGMGIWQLDLVSARLSLSQSMVSLLDLEPTMAPTTFDAFLDMIHIEDRAAVRNAFERAVHDRIDLTNEFRTVPRDGRVRYLAGRARVFYDDRRMPIRVIGVAMDISERKSLEDRLRQAQKMEAVGQLAGGIAHDFNNLLTAIHGYAELLRASAPDAAAISDLEEIVRAADRATSLTRQLLAFSRQQVLQPVFLDLNNVVEDTAKMLRRLIGEDIELVTSFAPAGNAVHADPGQLEQILINLVVNARDAMPGGGQLTIQTGVSTIDEHAAAGRGARPGTYATLVVKDSGIGMDEATKRRIFEPFFTTKERGRGTGLGLAMVYGIVNQSGGFISVSSEPGRGSTFEVYLPIADRNEAEPPRAEQRHAPGGAETILLVEDEDAVRALSRRLLQSAGYRVLDAASPEQADEVFRRHGRRVDLILTDVVMPGSSGPALYERLAAVQPDLRALYMSGYLDDTMSRYRELISRAGFLQKPFTRDGLLAKVREVLDR
jgi:signal transduction histidine kinase/DNA-binding response OmpR family regulator